MAYLSAVPMKVCAQYSRAMLALASNEQTSRLGYNQSVLLPQTLAKGVRVFSSPEDIIWKGTHAQPLTAIHRASVYRFFVPTELDHISLREHAKKHTDIL